MLELHFYIPRDTSEAAIRRALRTAALPEQRALKPMFSTQVIEGAVGRAKDETTRRRARALAGWWSMVLEDAELADRTERALLALGASQNSLFRHSAFGSCASGIVGHERYAAPYFIGTPLTSIPPDPAFVPNHLEAPVGVNGRFAWQFERGGGDDVTIHVVEISWKEITHTDPEIPHLARPPSNLLSTDDHCGKTLRLLFAQDHSPDANVWDEKVDAYEGTCGMVPNATAHVIEPSWSFASLFDALEDAERITVPAGKRGSDLWLFEIELIPAATDAAGITAWRRAMHDWASSKVPVGVEPIASLPLDVAPVFAHWLLLQQPDDLLAVIPLGNGTISTNVNVWPYYQATIAFLNELDEVDIALPPPALRVFAMEYQNIVGGPGGFELKLHGASNYVAPIGAEATPPVCAGPGYTIGVRAIDVFLDQYDRTSAASAVIAGAAASVLAIAGGSLTRDQLIGKFTGAEPSRAVVHGGRTIGYLPNVKTIVESLGFDGPNIRSRDRIPETGTGIACVSPDILIWPTADLTNTNVGKDEIKASSNLDLNRSIQLYVRVLNDGLGDAHNVFVRLFWAPATDLLSPSDWRYIKSARIATIPAGGWNLTPAIEWLPPEAGHFCLVAEIAVGGDVMPDRRYAIDDYASFSAYVLASNNVVWRNVNIVSAAPSLVRPTNLNFEFRLAGLGDTADRTGLEMIHNLPAGTTITLSPEGAAGRTHRELARELVLQPPPRSWLRRGIAALLNLVVPGAKVERETVPGLSFNLGTVALKRNDAATIHVRVSIPAKNQGKFELGFRRTWKETSLGGVTWQILLQAP